VSCSSNGGEVEQLPGVVMHSAAARRAECQLLDVDVHCACIATAAGGT
jgi:hypothetical protein